MNIATPECPRCRMRMDRGFIVDRAHGEQVVSHWTAGEPQKSMWGGLKVDKKKTLQVATFRCPKCGFLESYAPRESESS